MAPNVGAGLSRCLLFQGMEFITSIYSGFTPSLQSVGRVITSFQWTALLGGTKYKVSFNDGTTWFVYVFPSGGGSYSLSQGINSLAGNRKFNGYIHIAKIPIGDATSEATYDANNGAYVTGMALFGSTVGSTGTYGYIFANAGVSTSSVLHFAFPHHQASFDATTQNAATGIYFQSTTMEKMRVYNVSQWTMVETLPTDILFLPGGLQANAFSATAISTLSMATTANIGQDVSSESILNSQYFASNALANMLKFVLLLTIS